MIVVDASVVVSALLDSGPVGQWSETVLRQGALAAPMLLTAEATNVLRRAELAGQVSPEIAAQAFADLMALPIQQYQFETVSVRVWELRASVTTSGAWYVALAEALEASLATLDHRLARAPGPRCRFLAPWAFMDWYTRPVRNRGWC